VLERNSVLTEVLKGGGRAASDGQRRLRIGEARGWELVQLGAFGASFPQLALVVRPLLGTGLPACVGQAMRVGSRLLLKVGPEQFWVLTRSGDHIATALRSAVDPRLGSVTPLSHSRTCIWLEGFPAREVLASGIAVDLCPDVFELNHFALTGLHHTPLMVHRSSETRYDLYVLRTFAVWTWEWLVDAALPFGYEICGSSPTQNG
jgi:methylglutamate dehydrogenase subunit D